MAKEALFNDESGYVKGVVTYVVMDDLVVKPMSTTSKEISALEERVVHLGMDEVWYGSFWSEACNILFFFIMFYLFLLSEKVRISILLLGSEAAASLFAVQDSFNKCVPWDDRNTIQANDEYYVIKKIFASNIQRCLITYDVQNNAFYSIAINNIKK